MSAKLKRRLKIAAGLVCALILWVLVGWGFAPAILAVDSGPHPAGAVVVLGGESWTRPNRAAEVYHEMKSERLKTERLTAGFRRSPSNGVSALGPAAAPISHFSISNASIPSLNSPLVLASGNGDCQDARRQLEARGVPAALIATECDSRTTQENAIFSVKLLRAHGVTSAVIVTSWFHSRRALACFRKAAPEITFYARPTVRAPQPSWWPDAYERKRIAQEYSKIVYYTFVHGVNPF